jgi:hypothetical protein
LIIRPSGGASSREGGYSVILALENNNNKKKKQLGMPIGTASGRLKKIIMFELVKQLGKDTCFRCGEKILSELELSIEHKIPWLDSVNPVEKFFDLNNISFSHLKCNTRTKVPHGSVGYKKGCRCEACREAKRRGRSRYTPKI